MTKEHGPPGLTGVQSLGGFDVGQILMISPDNEWLFCPLQPVSPLLQHNGQ